MKKLIPFLVSGILVAGVVGCEEAPKTGETPGTSNEATSVPAKPASETTTTTEKTTETTTEATATPGNTSTTTSDLKAEVSKKLKEDLPSNKLEVEDKEGVITLKGEAASQAELTKAETLTKEVEGVKSVKVEAKVAPLKKP